MNVLISGASGYAGFVTAAALRQAGHQVTALMRRPDSERAQRLQVQEVRVVGADLREPDTYRAELEACDVFISTVLDHADRVGTDQRLFDTLRQLPAKADGSKRLFVYTTGCSIYGKVPEQLMDETTPGNPDSVLHFRMQMEQEAMKLDNVRTVVVRPGFMYGQDGRTCYINRWFEQGEAGQVVYAGDPARGWSWVHVSDLANAYLRLVEHSEPLDKEIFCLADDQQPLCFDVATAAARAAGFTGEVGIGPASLEAFTEVFDQNEFITSAKARRVLGWVPRQPGILAHMDLYYQGWKAGQALEGAAFSRGY